eukprot:392721-Amphidinium_carterae.2
MSAIEACCRLQDAYVQATNQKERSTWVCGGEVEPPMIACDCACQGRHVVVHESRKTRCHQETALMLAGLIPC